ncbi:MAG: eukaryotic-like serine/threonine-protein kinase [Actinoplanes sp.]|jgi:serine/threonine protein kinase|nr:eukaryotic-like serine/threonine-protein kinase [Actinoplanes sp.]
MNVDTAYRVSPLHRGDPEWLGAYELSGRLGSGGMGVVYLGTDRHGEYVAIKLVHASLADDPEFRGRFRSEVERARQVPSFCTAEVLDADLDHNPPYLVVEYVDGPSLYEVVEERGPLKANNLHSLAVGVASALAGIHGAGVIHRDLKPQNVLLAPGSPKVIDFGIARAFESTSQFTRTDQMVGTVAYMAPERFSSRPGVDLSPAADIFAWGCVVGYAGAGQTPFHGDSPPATAARILTQPPQLDGLAEPLRSLVELALAKAPADRPTAHELLEMLVSDRPPTRRVPALVTGGHRLTAVVDPSDGPRPGYDVDVHPLRPVSHKPPRIRSASGGSWLAFLAVLLLVAGLATAATVFGLQHRGGHPLVSGGAAGGGGAAGAGTADFPTATTLTPSVTLHPSATSAQSSVRPTSAAPTRTPDPVEPTGGELILKDALTAPGQWLDSEIREQHANCFTAGVMRAGRVDRGTYRCVGPTKNVADDFGVQVTTALQSTGSCSAVWFHWVPGIGGHILKICQDSLSVAADKPDDHKVYGTLTLNRPIRLKTATRVHLVLRGQRAEIYRAGAFVGSVPIPDGEPDTGQVVLGISVDALSEPPPFTVTFAALEIRSL